MSTDIKGGPEFHEPQTYTADFAKQASESGPPHTFSGGNDMIRSRLEHDALEIIYRYYGTRYGSLKEVNITDLLKIPHSRA
ncbi:MAG: hypothetical protein JXO48_06955 [Deltaproteobacteria bacterium]|nr:hypothetical protein [Deltaproteobacteria bacterium]